MKTKTCSKCNKTKLVDDFCKRGNQCKLCRHEYDIEYNKTHVKERLVVNILLEAKKRYREWGERPEKVKQAKWNLTRKWFNEQIATGKCARTGIPFEYKRHSPFIPSIDRIDPAKGYIKSNCQLVCAIYNYAKNRYKDTDVLKMSRALIKESKINK